MDEVILNKALRELIEKTEFHGDLMQLNWSNSNAGYGLVVLCLNNGIVTEDEYLKMIRERLLAWGRECYCRLINDKALNSRWYGFSICVPAMAFAICEGGIKPFEYRKLQFDHGRTIKMFCQEKSQGLVIRTANIMRQPQLTQTGLALAA